MNPTKKQIRQLRRDNQQWPEYLTAIPKEEWPPQPPSQTSRRISVFRNREFLVQVFFESGHVRLSVNSTDWDENQKRWREDITWEELMQIKRESGYGDRCAVELFPPDTHVVNVANMRHLWVLPDGETPMFMWRAEESPAPGPTLRKISRENAAKKGMGLP